VTVELLAKSRCSSLNLQVWLMGVAQDVCEWGDEEEKWLALRRNFSFLLGWRANFLSVSTDGTSSV
jgi:hypothetical protein